MTVTNWLSASHCTTKYNNLLVTFYCKNKGGFYCILVKKNNYQQTTIKKTLKLITILNWLLTVMNCFLCSSDLQPTGCLQVNVILHHNFYYSVSQCLSEQERLHVDIQPRHDWKSWTPEKSLQITHNNISKK